MSEKNNIITLYPSNWLYNAGVVGLLRVIESMDLSLKDLIKDDGSVQLDLNNILLKNKVVKTGNSNFSIPLLGFQWLIESWNTVISKKEEKTDEDKIKKIWGTLFNVYYRGLFNANTNYLFKPSKTTEALITQFDLFLKSFNKKSENKEKCSFCLTESNSNFKNQFTSEHSNLLGAASGVKGVPNSFWNLNPSNSLSICDLCSFIVISNHLTLTKLSDYTEIFINAPSFQLMYELNRLIKESFGSTDKEESRNKREILATTIIEYSRKIKSTLGIWTGMNLEIVIKNRGEIEFFSLPFNTIKIITDRSIASILSELGEFKILNLVLDKKYSALIDFGYKLLRLSTKGYNEFNASDKKLLNDMLYRNPNKQNLLATATKILKLYSLIEEKQKGVKKYEYTN